VTDTQPRIDQKALLAIAALVGAWMKSDTSDPHATLGAINGVLRIAGQQPVTDVERAQLAQQLLAGCAPVDEGTLAEELDLVEAVDAEREKCAKIADDYFEWTHWGQHDNAVAAESAAAEIAAAIRKGRWLTTDEIREVDAAHAARLKAQRERS
jgi:hypothetical protein